jgi:hydrogenase-1 operon protein HyaE
VSDAPDPTTAPSDAAPAPAPDLHPLLQRLMSLLQAPALGPDTLDAWASQPGHALLVFSEDPVRYRETLDLAVIVPELVRAYPGRFRVGLLPPAAARAVAPRYGFRKWPALVMLRDGRYVGAIETVRDWNEYCAEITRLLASEPVRPPGIGVAVSVEGPDAPQCH